MRNFIENDTKEVAHKNDNGGVLGEQYDEKLEGYYEVIKPAVNIRSTPNAKKNNNIVKVLLNGEKAFCDGHFEIIEGKRWLHVNPDSADGYILDKLIKKL